MTTTILFTLCFICLVLSVLSYWRISILTDRINKSLGGVSEGSIEEQLVSHYNQYSIISERLDKQSAQFCEIENMCRLSSQKIAIVRFNPFGDTGGDQSFCLAVLDSYNSGFVLTSIHGRQGTRVYVKPVDYGKSKYNLSQEEQIAVRQATTGTLGGKG